MITVNIGKSKDWLKKSFDYYAYSEKEGLDKKSVDYCVYREKKEVDKKNMITMYIGKSKDVCTDV